MRHLKGGEDQERCHGKCGPKGARQKDLRRSRIGPDEVVPRKFYMCVSWVNNAAAELLSREVVN